MSVTTPDTVVPGKLLRYEPLDFDVTTSVTEVTISIEYASGAWDVVYQDGRFAAKFAGSAVAGSHFTIVPPRGGWPETFVARAKESSSALTPALQSNLYTADAQWTLLNSVGSTPPTIDSSDRSGNARGLGVPNSLTFPALLSGRAALAPILGSVCVGSSGVSSALLKLGAMSLTAMICPSAYDPAASTDEWIYSRLDYTLGTTAGNCTCALLLGTSGGASTLTYYCRNGASTEVLFSMSAPRPKDGLWHFVSLSRNAAGTVVTLGLDGVYETSGTLLAPTGGASSIVTIGSAKGSTGKFQGAIYDVNHWPSALTNSQIEVLRKQAMGLP